MELSLSLDIKFFFNNSSLFFMSIYLMTSSLPFSFSLLVFGMNLELSFLLRASLSLSLDFFYFVLKT